MIITVERNGEREAVRRLRMAMLAYPADFRRLSENGERIAIAIFGRKAKPRVLQVLDGKKFIAEGCISVIDLKPRLSLKLRAEIFSPAETL